MWPPTPCCCACILSKSHPSCWYLPAILFWPTSLRAAVSLQAQAPRSPAKASPDLAKFLYFLSTFVSGCLLNCFCKERPPLNGSWWPLIL